MATAYRPHLGFFYLNDNASNPFGTGIKLRVLEADIRRGVKRLPEYAFSEHCGTTRSSMRFLNALRRMINVENAHRAELKYSQRDHFTLTVYTRDGFELVFKGVSGGYYGEGTRGCYDVLKACGFTDKQCQKVWANETFKVMKRSA